MQKKTRALVITLCLLLSTLIVVPSSAAEHPGVGSGSDRPEPQKQIGPLLSSDLIGRKLSTSAGGGLGDLEDLVLDESGRVLFLVVKMEERLIPVPWERFDRAGGPGESPTFILDIAPERLADAPSFSEEEWRVLGQRDWTERVYSFFASDRPPTDPGEAPPAPRNLRIVE